MDSQTSHKLISIDGNIGSGKSTLIEALKYKFKDNKNVVQNYFSQLIYASSDFAKILVDKYPVELYADIESMQKGATNCSCKTRVEDFCYKNRWLQNQVG